MGYACPVCDAPQRDAEHLANHLALTAMVHGGDHESWLDEHAPGWADSGPADLGERVASVAESAPYDEVFEDTVHGHVGESDHGHDRPTAGRPDASPSTADDDEATREAVAEARELTRQMLGGPDADGPGAGESDGTDGPGAGESDTGAGDAASKSESDGSGDAPDDERDHPRDGKA